MVLVFALLFLLPSVELSAGEFPGGLTGERVRVTATSPPLLPGWKSVVGQVVAVLPDTLIVYPDVGDTLPIARNAISKIEKYQSGNRRTRTAKGMLYGVIAGGNIGGFIGLIADDSGDGKFSYRRRNSEEATEACSDSFFSSPPSWCRHDIDYRNPSLWKKATAGAVGFAVGAALGAGIGALIAAGTKSEGWRAIPLSTQMEVSRKEVFVAIGFGLIGNRPIENGIKKH